MCLSENWQSDMNVMDQQGLEVHVIKQTFMQFMSQNACVFVWIHTSEVQIVGGVNDNPHQGEVERSHLGSNLRFNTPVVKIMGTQQAVDGIDGLSLDLSSVNTSYQSNYSETA